MRKESLLRVQQICEIRFLGKVILKPEKLVGEAFYGKSFKTKTHFHVKVLVVKPYFK